MELAEAIDKGWPLVVDSPVGGIRYAAEMFITSHGVVFHDIGWDTGSTHGVHLLEGELTGDGPWRVGRAVIRVIEDDEEVMGDMMDWQWYRTTPEGARATREAARKYMCASFGWTAEK